jgi:hypothetical protein
MSTLSYLLDAGYIRSSTEEQAMAIKSVQTVVSPSPRIPQHSGQSFVLTVLAFATVANFKTPN